MSDDNELGGDVPEQSEPMSLSDDMGEPRFDIAGVALGAVPPAEAAEVRAAAAADPALAAELAAMREVVAELASVAPSEIINRGRSAGIRSRLIARAAASKSGRHTDTEQADRSLAASQRLAVPPALAVSGTGTNRQRAEPGHARRQQEPRQEPRPELGRDPRAAASRAARALGWIALAASIAFAAVSTQLWRVSREHDQLAGAIASQRATLAQKVDQLQASVAARDSVISTLTGTRTRVIDLASYSSLAPVARMFWDQKTQQWTMYASQLKQPQAGKTYQLWLIAAGHKAPISAGTFNPGPAGSAVVHAKYALEPGTLRRIAVTEEPAGGVAAPTGPIVFAGVGK
ncbi:MAG: anti-sigma factor [Gemmatimonadaceae bacterium]